MSGVDECAKVFLKYGYRVPSPWKPTYDYTLQAKHSCVFYDEKLRRCNTLKRTYCKYEDCKFYKGRE